ncbi:endocuticle structural glycoprotein SgAbd-9-like [Rhodnius prolixus]|uniref:endocuticle structural glycoprotein SgAbd-9-like n=1 Tax=Rhodnius prolixus TaxID=13249 RepID=UPI003D187DD9
MISSVVFLLLVAGALSAPQFNPYYTGAFVPIVSQHYDLNPDQSYSFAYRSGDGSARDEVGTPRAPGPEGPAVTVQGSYAYNSPAGPVQVQYVADENGYQPAGPNVHPAIIKAVAQQVAQARTVPFGAYRQF